MVSFGGFLAWTVGATCRQNVDNSSIVPVSVPIRLCAAHDAAAIHHRMQCIPHRLRYLHVHRAFM